MDSNEWNNIMYSVRASHLPPNILAANTNSGNSL